MAMLNCSAPPTYSVHNAAQVRQYLQHLPGMKLDSTVYASEPGPSSIFLKVKEEFHDTTGVFGGYTKQFALSYVRCSASFYVQAPTYTLNSLYAAGGTYSSPDIPLVRERVAKLVQGWHGELGVPLPATVLPAIRTGQKLLVSCEPLGNFAVFHPREGKREDCIVEWTAARQPLRPNSRDSRGAKVEVHERNVPGGKGIH